LTVVTPERLVFDGFADHVVLPTHDGYIGFLPGHYPLLGIVGTGELKYIRGKDVRFMSVSGGVFEINNNHIRVLADVAESAEHIDIARAQRAFDRAKMALKSREDERDDAGQATAALNRAMSRLRVTRRVEP